MLRVAGRGMVLTSENLFKSEGVRRKKQRRIGEYPYLLLICMIAASIPIWACSHFAKGSQAESTFRDANDLFNKGNYRAALSKYGEVIAKDPKAGDRVLFEMGILYAYPQNEEKDYQKAMECFQKLMKDYPGSAYRKDSEMMILHIANVTLKDRTIAAQRSQIENQQSQIETLQQTQRETLQEKERAIASQQSKLENLQEEVKSKADEITSLLKRIELLEQKVWVLQKGPADRILVEKGERRLTLMSKGEVLRTYKIALGGNPNGPKERQGDNKTPEGIYIIDSRNKNSRFHRSLHISYPNEKDKQRARKLGVSPGGNIMIHGLKEGFSWAGELHTEVDWTEGCIAVTDEEIEEIEKLVPNGTTIEIRP